MMRIHLLTPSIIPGDAVSNDLLGMRRWLRRRGVQAHAYAGRCHEDLRKLVRPLSAYRRHLKSPDDVLIYHHSVGWPAGMAYYEMTHNRKVVRYHNVTPPAFYRPYNSGHVRACLRGLEETRLLAQSRAELFLADSEFNLRELVQSGARAELCHSVPPLHQIGSLGRVAQDQSLAARLRHQTNLLFVGRITPNKGHLHLIRALAHYVHFLGRKAHLYLVGSFDAGIPGYLEVLQSEIRRHRLLDHVHLTGKVMAAQLRTYFAHASVFLCTSEHEGFCVPLVEAMYYGIPIVAYGGTAIAQTLGDASLLWDTPQPALFAESIRKIVDRPEVRTMLVQAQKRRFRNHFSGRAIRHRLQEVLAHTLGNFSRLGTSHPHDPCQGRIGDDRSQREKIQKRAV